jgi:adenylate cyclase
MWSLTITNPRSEPLQVKVVPGKMTIGRMDTCDIVINDVAASRRHAEIFYDPLPELVTIKDLKSSNGTYVNRQKISGLLRMQDGDIIRIGQTEMHLTRITDSTSGQKGITGTCLFTRDLVLEAVDEHPIILQEITEKLNTVTDVDTAMSEVVEMIKQAMGVDVCEIILAQDFKNIPMDDPESLIAKTIRNSSVETSPLAICVPVISSGKPLALIYMEKQRQDARPFDKRDMQLAVAISHQTTLTIQRIELLAKIRKEGEVKQLLMRFVSPIEADDILQDYLKTGHFPDLTEKKVTVLFVEPADSTGLAERIGPKNFSSFMNTFYQYCTQVVFRKGGMVKYLGDGVLAVFMEAKGDLAPEDRAVSAACEIIEYVKHAESPELDRPCVVGIAINTGKAMVGYVGSEERAEFNVMGNLIKVTYRMQEYAVPNRIFVGLSTADAIRNKYLVQKTGSLGMRGSDQPIQVFEVSYAKTAPFVQGNDKDSMMSAAFKAIAEKLKAKSEKVE